MKSSYLFNSCSIKQLLSLQILLQNSCHSGLFCISTALYLVLWEKSHSTIRKRSRFPNVVNSEPQQPLLVSGPPLCLPLPFPLGCFCSFQEDAMGASEDSLYFPCLAIILYHHSRSYKQQFSPQVFCHCFHHTI